jgi:AcrR family transcriptional regulator
VVRADAQENRARIVEVAREALADGDVTSMNQIAQRAGVGPGTLYRHFPTREALVLEVYRRDVDDLVTAVPDLLERLPPLEALRVWTTELVAAMRRKHGLGDALSAGAHTAVAEESRGPVVAAIAALFRAGQRDGTIRDDAEPEDFLQLTGALWRAATGPTDRSGPMLALVLDGLATPRDAPARRRAAPRRR